ncbi:MAG TPA: dipeptidyl aminopeptidase [Stackebrandtia sp.]|jgi:alpha-beta hydrolase superfamily lysophospholipase|uniref:alpha/beta hydrolase family protein n=1 Tax=Stackebrandtia sp. TaxID=2023065 RepID=UPI002D6E7D83|nr:dipeptidyl aminopeptidase [Stackebrandtia sp.]HZE38530.1 dipeptidyl aminopeptidase [Stackebrandtia sp.]
MRPIVFEKDSTFWYETLRLFNHIAYGGADFGEVLTTAQAITEGDYDSWHDEWHATARRVAADAAAADRAGHQVSARDGYLRAFNYFRSAEFFLHGNASGDPRVNAAYEDAVACFERFTELSDTRIEPVRIPYEGTTLPGYFYTAPNAPTPGPTMIMHSGFDGGAEELHFQPAAALVERGFHVLTFDGPGQAGPMHREGLVFRPDWENVVSPVLDYAEARPEVDGARMGLLGLSMGGVLAPRAAAFEPRVAALVAWNGLYDMASVAMRGLELSREQAKALVCANVPLDAGARLREDPTARWAVQHGMWVTGSATPREYVAAMFDYHVGDGIAERIACPTLVCDAPADFAFAGQPAELYAHLNCPKTFAEFTAEEGADAHCQVGAARLAAARIGDWLESTLNV